MYTRRCSRHSSFCSFKTSLIVSCRYFGTIQLVTLIFLLFLNNFSKVLIRLSSLSAYRQISIFPVSIQAIAVQVSRPGRSLIYVWIPAPAANTHLGRFQAPLSLISCPSTQLLSTLLQRNLLPSVVPTYPFADNCLAAAGVTDWAVSDLGLTRNKVKT
jgi:hypothetical protein